VHCNGTLGMECVRFKDWQEQRTRKSWLLQEMAEALTRKTEDKKELFLHRRVDEMERRVHESRMPEIAEEDRTSFKGWRESKWFHGETEWYTALVPQVNWEKAERLEMKKLTGLVGVGIHVDDVVTSSDE
jgi:hypothetical protein